jgi:ribosome biogenesis GTPase
MELKELGYHTTLENFRQQQNLTSFDVGRVVSEHKERYVVKTTENEFDAEIIGNLRFTANTRSDFPAVGDWVAIAAYDDDKVLIHAILPRKTTLERQATGKQGEKQIIATNIDYAFIVQAVDRDFNLNRIERYLTICHSAKVTPLIILNKIDLLDDAALNKLNNQLSERIQQVEVMAISNTTQEGIEALKMHLQKGKTYCLLGSSGVGKSSLINSLTGTQKMKTNTISSSTNKGRHVTSHRELVVLESGGILIDNPGIREVGITDSSVGLETTFETITALADGCRFKDCTHTTETGCAVLMSVDTGEIDKSAYENFLRMEREKTHFESTLAEKRQKDKDFGKMVKNFKKLKNLKNTE